MKTIFLSLLLMAATTAAEPKRPKILGIAHMALYVHDIGQARGYYKDFLGYGEPFQLNNADGSLSLTFIKVNEDQYIELFPEKQAGTDRLAHIAIQVEDAEAMRVYLAAHGVKVPATTPKGRTRNSNYMITDPDGHLVEIVQYEPDGFTRREAGKYLDGPRISRRIAHVGITVAKLEPAMQFYGELLGFREIWRGSKEGRVLDWVNMQVPDGEDYIEFMLYGETPTLSLARLGTLNHICLEVDDIHKVAAELEQRPARKSYLKPMEIKTGVNRKQQLNLYDPDGTRSELMEPKTVDGVPARPSTAPPLR